MHLLIYETCNKELELNFLHNSFSNIIFVSSTTLHGSVVVLVVNGVSVGSPANFTQGIYLNINQLDALNFIISFFHASTCFEHK